MTVAVAEVQMPDGSVKKAVTSNLDYLPRNIQKTLNEDEIYVGKAIKGHAEATLFKWAKDNNATVLDISASRPICATCEVDVVESGAKHFTPFKSVLKQLRLARKKKA
jgi:hypothetical protein